MKVNDKAAVRASSNGAGISLKAEDEIDLYDELAAFLKLSPVQKLRYLNRPGTRSSNEATQCAAPEPVETAFGEVGVDGAEPASAATSSDEIRTEGGQKGPSGLVVADEFSAGAALTGMNPEYVFTNVLSGLACPGCGAQSEADDLFCMSCGAFLNGVGSSLPFNPNCTDCSGGVEPDEIFCPWCGSTLSDN